MLSLSGQKMKESVIQNRKKYLAKQHSATRLFDTHENGRTGDRESNESAKWINSSILSVFLVWFYRILESLTLLSRHNPYFPSEYIKIDELNANTKKYI